MRYHHTYHYIMAIIKRTDNNKEREFGSLIQSWWECKMVALLWKTVWQFLKMKILNIDLSYICVCVLYIYNLAISLLGTYPREMKHMCVQ